MNDHIEKLKKVKVPLWARLLGDYRARKRAKAARKQVRHIATVHLKMSTREGATLTGYIHLFETGDGVRSYKYERGELSHVVDYRRWSLYHDTIIPWTHGKFHNEDIRVWAGKTRLTT